MTGSTGYIGGRLAPRLVDAGYSVKCIVRNASKLKSREWAQKDSVEIVEGDAEDEKALAEAMRGCRVAYYLIHSMKSAGGSFRDKDKDLAEVFGRAAAKAGVLRIIYMGGLGDESEDLSEHLKSRREVEKVLGQAGVSVTVLRAAMIIGSGSASFEIMRYLVERLPIMITPKWVRTDAQPIAISDVLFYLQACLETPETTGKVLDIGGPDIMSYSEIMEITASALELSKRFVIPVPILTPRLSSLWIHLVTPISADIARPLAVGLRNRVVCTNFDALELMPHNCLTIEEAVNEAIAPTLPGASETSWSDAGPLPGDPDWAGGTVYVDTRAEVTSAPIESVWRSVTSLGGKTGYYGSNWLWRIRGRLDRMIGGPGLRRGRRHPKDLRVGDALDFWRVLEVDAPHCLVLIAEMIVPGVAQLGFDVQPFEGKVRVEMTAKFRPKGLFGLI